MQEKKVSYEASRKCHKLDEWCNECEENEEDGRSKKIKPKTERKDG